MAKAKRITVERILEDYKINEDELKELVFQFGEKDDLPEGLLKELVRVTIAPANKENEPNQQSHSYLRMNKDGKGFIPFAIMFNEPTWITKSELKVIERLGIQDVSKDTKRSGTAEKGRFSRIKMILRFTIMKGFEMVDLKRPK